MKKLFYTLALGAVVSMNAQEESLRILNVNLNITIRDQVTEIAETLPVDTIHCFDFCDGQYLLDLKLTLSEDSEEIFAEMYIKENTVDGYQVIAEPTLVVTPSEEATMTVNQVQNTYGGETEQIELQIKLLIS